MEMDPKVLSKKRSHEDATEGDDSPHYKRYKQSEDAKSETLERESSRGGSQSELIPSSDSESSDFSHVSPSQSTERPRVFGLYRPSWQTKTDEEEHSETAFTKMKTKRKAQTTPVRLLKCGCCSKFGENLATLTKSLSESMNHHRDMSERMTQALEVLAKNQERIAETINEMALQFKKQTRAEGEEAQQSVDRGN